ncbi:MAG: winged helix-turn-helix transcriptional regulator [Magnetospirillum gryphiswaldense]|nr:winged helix-turn-helix transcriptional regulator [Magnetospirillum gryphiswaldense]
MNEDSERLLRVLDTVEQNSTLGQRDIAREVGVALGLANTYIKRAIKKGLLKAVQAPANRYAYYLTPQGIAEKSLLTVEFLSQSFRFFRLARSQCEEILEQCAASGWNRVALFGSSDLAQIMILCALESNVSIVSVIDAEQSKPSFSGIPTSPNIEMAPPFDVIVFTHMKSPGLWNQIHQSYPNLRIRAPKLLKLPVLSATKKNIG